MQSLGKSNLDLETGGDGGRSSGEELCGGGVAAEKSRRSSAAAPECLAEVDLETGDRENEGHSGKSVRDCRICHLGLDAENPDSGLPIELGCSCKDDLAVAHKHCAEAWFKIRGNKTCEICGSIAQSVVDVNDAEHDPEHFEQSSDASTAAVTTELPGSGRGSRDFWQGHRFLNLLLACMVFAFVISWLFHFNVPS